ncbi:Zn(2)-C6 fungal-type domain-containing protein [Mycena kentingensis (nom. inval.)]|nr:Zn(2)-C6 fungal-type domain-containing protein [Mycena kentingensis (nom. inval.)]
MAGFKYGRFHSHAITCGFVLVSMSSPTSPKDALTFSTLFPDAPRQRAPIACVHCRKRKIRCIAEQNMRPCERCVRKGLQCDYMPVADPRNNAPGSAPASPTTPSAPQRGLATTSAPQAHRAPPGSVQGGVPHPHAQTYYPGARSRTPAPVPSQNLYPQAALSMDAHPPRHATPSHYSLQQGFSDPGFDFSWGAGAAPGWDMNMGQLHLQYAPTPTPTPGRMGMSA